MTDAKPSSPALLPAGEEGRKLNDRDEDSYVIDAAAKLLKVLEALAGCNFEPVNIQRVVQRTGLGRDFCRRALITLKKSGWAKQLLDSKESIYALGPKAENMAKRYGASMLARNAAGQ